MRDKAIGGYRDCTECGKMTSLYKMNCLNCGRKLLKLDISKKKLNCKNCSLNLKRLSKIQTKSKR